MKLFLETARSAIEVFFTASGGRMTYIIYIGRSNVALDLETFPEDE